MARNPRERSLFWRSGFIALLFHAFTASAQLQSMPPDYFFARLSERRLARTDSVQHTGILPYIPFFSRYYNQIADTATVFRFIKDDPGIDIIFRKHLIELKRPAEGVNLRIDPILNLEAGNDLADSAGRLYTNSRGLFVQASFGKRVYIESLFAESQSLLPAYAANRANTSGVVPGQGRWKRFKSVGFDYAFATALVSVQVTRNVNIQAGHGKQKIGYGYRSLLLSDNSFNYPFARITQRWFRQRLEYTNVYAALTNLVPATSIVAANAERLFQRKAAAFQYASLLIGRRLTIGAYQGIVWSAGDARNRQHLEAGYFNPLIFSSLADAGLNTKANILCGGQARLKISSRASIYGQTAWRPSRGDSASFGGYQAGLLLFDVFHVRNLFVQLEYNNADKNLYASQLGSIRDQSYFHYNDNLAFTPDYGRELLAIFDFRRNRWFANVLVSYQEKDNFSPRARFTTVSTIRGGYLINPAYNLNIAAGTTLRTQKISNFKPDITQYFFIALKTSIYNTYFDF